MAMKIRELSQGSISADEKSIYRALSRFEKFGILRSKRENSNIGPPRKYYFITELGESLLEEFINRNLKIFYTPEIQARIFNIIDKATINEGEQHE
jgi:DNA-binding PadR family transcriptional regulator